MKKPMLCYICIAVAAAFSFIFAPMANQNTRETVTVVRIVGTEPVPVGTQLTAEMLTTVEVGAYGLPDNAARKTEDVIDQFALTPIYPEDNITTNKVSPSLPEDNNLYSIKKGTCAVSVTVSGLSAGFSAKLQEGDIVSAYSIIPDETSPTGIVVGLDPILQYMEILSVNNSKAENADATKVESSEQAIPSTVTFRCTSNQAAKLIEIESLGKIHLTFVGRTEEAQAQLKAFNEWVAEQE